VRNRWTRIVIPVLGLFAVTAALALVAIAPLVLFPGSKDAGPRPVPPAASSEVASVTAPPFRTETSADTGAEAPAQPAASPTVSSIPTSGAPGGGGSGPTGGLERSSPGPGAGQAGVASNGGDADKTSGPSASKGKHKGKAKGHVKSKAHGKAKGHGKWQPSVVVALPSHGASSDHVHPPRAGKHSGRGAHHHARPRG
jgi:hypothetical protein